eukprot:6190752-Lingulodinium_polyedra.AAC.1
MTRSNRPSAVAAVRKSHASRVPCEHHLRCLHGVREACDLQGLAAADGRFDRIIVHGCSKPRAMMRSSRPSAAAAARTLHAPRISREDRFLAYALSARGV